MGRIMDLKSWSGMWWAICLALIFLGVTVIGGSPAHSEEYFYYSDGKKIPLKLSPYKVAVRFRVSLDTVPDRLQDLIHAPQEQKAGDLVIVPLKAKTEDIAGVLARLSADPAVEEALPVFDAPGADMVATNEFIAKFKPGVSQEKITQINAQHGVEIVKKASWDPNTYILRVPAASALETANRYHELDEVEYAHPNFVRFMVRPVSSVDRKRFVWGPDNKLLPEDFVVPKDAEGYRVMEKADITIKDSTPPVTSQIAPSAPVNKKVIRSEGFEGGIPGDFVLSGKPTWGATTYRKYAGTRSAYCVGSSVNPPGPYPNNANAWMKYGPFSLADAKDARLSLRAWIKTKYSDYFWVVASTNGTNFSGWRFSGNWTGQTTNGWVHIAISFSDLSLRKFSSTPMIGKPQVWFAVIFQSNSSTTDEGAYVDNIVLEKITGGYQSITNDVYEHYQWALNNNGQRWGKSGYDVKALSAWGISQGKPDIKIAIIDSGVDLNHPDLKAKLVPGYDATGHGSAGAPSGNEAHGTCCAGIAAGVTNNSLGIAGIARNCKIMPVRVFYKNMTTDAWLADGLAWAANHNADVLSNSWGGGSASTAITTAINNAVKNGRGGKGCVVLFSSGNNNAGVSYPAYLSNVLAIGAVSPAGERKSPDSDDGEYWWGSNYGSQLDICAPGPLCYTTDITGSAGYSTDDYFPNFNGTSSACPHAAGVAGLILSVNPDLTADQAKKVMTSNATDLGPSGFDIYTGWGLVNAYKALQHTPGGGDRTTSIIPLLLD